MADFRISPKRQLQDVQMMDTSKTKKRFVDEPEALKERVTELEQPESDHQQAGELLKALFNSSPIGLYIVQDGCFQAVSSEFQQISGYSEKNLIGSPSLSLVFPDDRDMVRGNAVKALKGESSSGYEFRIVTKGGETKWVMETVAPVQYYGMPATLGNFMDITRRKDMEEALRGSEQFNSSLLKNSLHPILLINPDTSIEYINPALEKLTGFTSAELLGKKAPYPWLTKESLPKTRKDFKVAMRRGANWFEELYQNRDGGQFWVEIISAPIMHNGELRYYIASWVDITERKQMENALRVEKERAEGYLDIAGVMMATVNTSEEITLMNKKGCEILGYEAGEVIGRNWFDTLFPERTRGEIRDIFGKLLTGDIGPVKYYENPLLTKDGEEKLIAFTNAAIKDPDGQIVGVLISGEDISELRKAQEQLQHSRLLASLGEMTAGIAHEVNNPLGSILLYSELLIANDVPSQTRRDLKIIHEEAKRAAKIMTDLLIYGRRTRSQIRRLNLHNPLKKVLEMRRYEQRVQNIAVLTNLQDRPLYVNGDSSQIMQVLMNLVLNAEEALRESNGGNIVITTQDIGEWARVSIADDGIGIPHTDLNQVFYPFFTTKQVGEGTGLGLSTCYGIITGHNGLIRAENNEMGGATFIIELPLANGRKRGSSPNKRKGKSANSPVKVSKVER